MTGLTGAAQAHEPTRIEWERESDHGILQKLGP